MAIQRDDIRVRHVRGMPPGLTWPERMTYILYRIRPDIRWQDMEAGHWSDLMTLLDEVESAQIATQVRVVAPDEVGGRIEVRECFCPAGEHDDSGVCPDRAIAAFREPIGKDIMDCGTLNGLDSYKLTHLVTGQQIDEMVFGDFRALERAIFATLESPFGLPSA